MTDDILVAGSGIAGLTTAIALARLGIGVTVLERTTGFQEVGAGLQLSPNATRVLGNLGLAGAIGRLASAPDRLDIRRWSEPRTYAGMPMNAGRANGSDPFWVIRRADLHVALLDAARFSPRIRLLVGREVTAVRDHGDRIEVTVRTAQGQSETIDGPALIGADGVWSAVRHSVDPTTSPRFLGFEAWRTLVPAGGLHDMLRKPAVNLWLGQGRHAVHYPVAHGREINLVIVRAGQDERPGWDRLPDSDGLATLAGEAAGPLADLIRAAPAWRTWPLYDCPPARMARGRVALVGDAAHPVLPFLAQGAALAIEDAAMLADALAPALASAGPNTVPQALAGYASLRRPRALRVQQAAQRNARAYHAGFPLDRMRDLVLRRLGDTGMQSRYGWLYDWRMPAAGTGR